MLKSSIGGEPANARVPFLRQELTGEHLASIDVIELDVPVTTPDQMHSAFLDQSDTAIKLEDAELRVVTEEWGFEVVRIRASRTGGIAPGALPRVMENRPITSQTDRQKEQGSGCNGIKMPQQPGQTPDLYNCAVVAGLSGCFPSVPLPSLSGLRHSSAPVARDRLPTIQYVTRTAWENASGPGRRSG